MIRYTLYLLAFMTLLGQDLYAQSPKILHDQVTMFSLDQSNGDSIAFIILGTNLTQPKPVLLWCQGSLPVPLFVDLDDYGPYLLGGGLSNMPTGEISKIYHLVVISMPHTPVTATDNQVNAQYQYIPDPSHPKRYAPEYLEADYLDNYSDRGLKVLEFLKTQSWVQTNKLVVAGHSQGAKVATKIARNDSIVTHLGLFGANPMGRIDERVRQVRFKAQSGEISWEEADAQMEKYYQFYSEVQDPAAAEKHPEYKAWKSFSEPFYDDWLELEIPIYLAYGTEDRVADLCDLVPLFFIEQGKSNLSWRRYLHREHNFFPVDKEGLPDYDRPGWPVVILDFLTWLAEGPTSDLQKR